MASFLYKIYPFCCIYNDFWYYLVMNKVERVCQYHKLSIRKNGDICPCCISGAKIANIYDTDFKEKIQNNIITCECTLYKSIPPKENQKPDLKYLHLEFSNECQARCLVCFQHKETLPREDEHFAKLTEIIDVYKPQSIIAIGGEVLIQEKTLDWLYKTKQKHPEICFETVTNLCVSDEKLKKAMEVFDIFTISMLGFQEQTYNSIMGLDFNRTLKNIDILKFNQKTLRPKFLAMPSNFLELPLFLKWALKKDNMDKIYLHNAYEFQRCINLAEDFWAKSFAITEKQVKKILIDNKEYILSRNKHLISIHSFIAQMLNINEEYLKTTGLDTAVKLAS